MTSPAVAWLCSLHALGLGMVLGCLYGFLRPLRPRVTHLADGLFVLGCGWAWVYHSFALCGGDPRVGYLPAAVLGGLLWEKTAGKLLCPLWTHFWRIIGGFLGTLRKMMKNIFGKMKKLFAYLGKWGTIE